MSLDFTLKKYEEFCSFLKDKSCPVMTLEEFFRAGQPSEFSVILRHDIDRGLKSALRLAKLESRYNINSTYYVRMTKSVYQPLKIKHLIELGHEVGYHYETLTKARGDQLKAIDIFANELEMLRQICSINTISMHGSPLTPWNNMDLWKDYDFSRFNILADAMLSIDYSKLYYFTDTGGSWNAGKHNIRDKTDSLSDSLSIETTDDLMDLINDGIKHPIIINTHPNRWAKGLSSYLLIKIFDYMINRVKLVVCRAKSA